MWYNLARKSTLTLVKMLGGYEITNSDIIKNRNSCIIASNHISYFDPPFIGSIIPGEINYLAKSDLFKIPVFGSLIKSLNALPVKRGSVDRLSLESVKNVLTAGKSILIFPEGSRKNYTAKPGIGKIVYETKCTVIPVYVKNTNNLFSCLFRKRKLRLLVGDPISFSSYNIENKQKKESYRFIADEILNKIKALNHEN